jgi:hypothetical protein
MKDWANWVAVGITLAATSVQAQQPPLERTDPPRRAAQFPSRKLICSSTRRFAARPKSLSLLATGRVSA